MLAAVSRVRRMPAAFGTFVPRAASVLSIVLGCAWMASSL